jgi:hypothetical protein
MAGGFDLRIKIPLPNDQSLAVHDDKLVASQCLRDRAGLLVQRNDKPIVEQWHFDFFSAQIVEKPDASFAVVVNLELFAEEPIFDDDVIGFVLEFIRQDLDLIQAVRVVVHRQNYCERGIKIFKHVENFKFSKVADENIRRGGTAIRAPRRAS